MSPKLIKNTQNIIKMYILLKKNTNNSIEDHNKLSLMFLAKWVNFLNPRCFPENNFRYQILDEIILVNEYCKILETIYHSGASYLSI